MSKPTYTFTTQLVRDVKSPTEHPGMIMLGKFDSDGKVEAIMMKNINKNINLRLTGSFQSSNVEQGVLGADIDIEGIFSKMFQERTQILYFDSVQAISVSISCRESITT